MPLDQDAQALGVEAQHVAHAAVLDAEGSLRAARPGRLGGVIRRRADRLHLDHGEVAQRAEARLGS
jgi:hypothetical protein